MAYYLANDVRKIYYDQIKRTGSTENDVDNFYLQVLPVYFSNDGGFAVEHESRPLGMSSRTDFAVRYVRSGLPKKVIIFECKRRAFESHSSQWAAALEQAIDYVHLVRVENVKTSAAPIHIVIAIGTHLRVYTHQKGDGMNPDPFHLYPNELLELARDEAKVDAIFREMNRITKN